MQNLKCATKYCIAFAEEEKITKNEPFTPEADKPVFCVCSVVSSLHKSLRQFTLQFWAGLYSLRAWNESNALDHGWNNNIDDKALWITFDSIPGNIYQQNIFAALHCTSPMYYCTPSKNKSCRQYFTSYIPRTYIVVQFHGRHQYLLTPIRAARIMQSFGSAE